MVVDCWEGSCHGGSRERRRGRPQQEEERLTCGGGDGRRRVGLVGCGRGRALRASGVRVGREGATAPAVGTVCFERERDVFWQRTNG
jgi:hypothetical protein